MILGHFRPEARLTESAAGTPLDSRLCLVVGVNQNYVSEAGTLYHIQIEDRGPVVDRVSEGHVRRVNVIVYANYGDPNARIVYSRDHDFDDVRTQEHNRFIEQQIQSLVGAARSVIEQREQRLVARIKGLLRQYYLTKDEAAKREFESTNALYPFVFSRAWRELKDEHARPASSAPEAASPVTAEPEAPAVEVYPLDSGLRDAVLEIERLIMEVGRDLNSLKARGGADDILLQTCRKLVARAKESLAGRTPSEFSARRLDMTRNSLKTTWKQVRSRLKP
jgi:hypothetical protein